MTTDQTKIIIVTANQSLIEQICSNNIANTQVLDVTNNEQNCSAINGDNIISNLAFLAQLSDGSSKNERIYKRALDSTDRSGEKPAKVSKKPMICAICGGRAIGYNYNVSSCSSCKAFFRRHVNQSLDEMQCLLGQNQCSLSHETRRRKCQKCRLHRCFEAGMKKEFMFSEEEKERRRKHCEEKRNASLISNVESVPEISLNGNEQFVETENDINWNGIEDISWEILSIEDWLIVESVRRSFLTTFETEDIPSLNFDVADTSSALMELSQFSHSITLRFISFIREINEFHNLHIDDRFSLVKYNIHLLSMIWKCFYYKPIDTRCSNEHFIKLRRFFALCGVSEDIQRTLNNLVLSLVELTKQDSATLSLLTMILIFSHGISMNDDESPLKDSAAVYRAQLHYTDLFEKHLNSKYDELQVIQQLTLLLTLILRMQSICKQLRELYQAQYLSYNLVDKVIPLLQTTLDISST
ncbi:unnamed protein product [Adineta ricciae]|uniref:Uncharacterized protein n=1 Tax=Adineta ricciae TaxID=249248 RepID=A0A815K409_ADIRI|nr:unnamed protein product [Adineta ricciae]CAF1390592.1 unnamed protein product [Adineta ricciae]